MFKPKYIKRLMLVAVMLLLAVASATAQTNNVYTGQTSLLSVVDVPGETYQWELYHDATGINFAVDTGNCEKTEAIFTGNISTGHEVHVTWLTPGTYFYKVTARRSGCTMNLKVGKIDVQPPASDALISISQSSACIGQPVNLIINLSGSAPWSVTYRITKADGTIQDVVVNNITKKSSQFPFTPTIPGTYTFEVISVSDTFTTKAPQSNIVSLTVNAKPASSRIYQYDPVTNKKK